MRETVIVTPDKGPEPFVEEAPETLPAEALVEEPTAEAEEPEDTPERKEEVTPEETPVIVDDADSDEDEEL